MHTKRIARGARWLDKKDPGWYQKIGKPLDMTDTRCVIGQVYGSFEKEMDRRYLIPSWNARPHTTLQSVAYFIFMILHPGTWFGMRFCVSHGFISGFETARQWRESWADEIHTRHYADEKRQAEAWQQEKVPVHN